MLGTNNVAVSLQEYAERKQPDGFSKARIFNFTEYFHGHTRVSGWFSDRFGNPRRHFCGDFHGSFQGADFQLHEKLYYTDGLQEEREWVVSIDGSGVFTAQSDSLVGSAEGVVQGDRLAMHYTMHVMVGKDKYWKLRMKDLMILQPDGSLHNITQVYKWGVRIGTVSTQYRVHDGKQLCADLLAGSG
jgi:hypothetical protein